jgi:hypothetical protein
MKDLYNNMHNKFLIPILFMVSLGAACTVGCDIFDSGSPPNKSSQDSNQQNTDGGKTPGTGQTPGGEQPPSTGQTPDGEQPPSTGQTPGGEQPPSTQNTTWYVSSNGSNSAAGDSASAPLATVQAALDKIKSLYRGGKWPTGQSAVIVVSGKITASSGYGPVGAMVDVSGAGNYPHVILKGDPAAGGVLDAGNVSGNGRQVLYIANNKVTLGDKLVLTGGRSLWGGAVLIGMHGSESEGEFVMDGGEITSNSGGSGGAVMIYKGSMSMLGGLIANNNNDFLNSNGYGGGIAMQSGTYFIMSGGKIENNGGQKTEKGGGLYIDGQAQAYMTGGEITSNKSDLQGGGVYVIGDFTMSAGTVSSNVSLEGGGIRTGQYMGTFNKLGGLIAGNKPDDY